MANLRVVYNNSADRATLSATAGVGTLVAANLLTDIKSEVWRTATTSASITLTWTNAELIGCVALPFCNLSATATIRVRGYTEVADVAAAVDTGVKLACPVGTGVAPAGVNSYAYAGASYAVAWLAQTSVKKVVVDLVDTGNSYIEAARVVAGAYWSPINNADYGAQLTMVDTSKHERSDAGDLRTERGYMHKKINLDLSVMPAEDRNVIWSISRINGMSKPMLLSLTPEVGDATEEQTFSLYGKLSQQSSIRYQFANQYNTTIELEEI
jgi:hypothetical protein